MAPQDRRLWRLIDSSVVTPEFSVAADEAILNAKLRDLVPNTVHFYTRNSPTVSVGCNKAITESVKVDEAEKRGVGLVRRFSGGNAVYTDKGQLIFALVIDKSLLPTDIVDSYGKVCSAIIRGLSMLGVRAEYKPVNDIMVDGLKISGSAQLRRGSAILHHGTLMVDTDLANLTAVLKPARDGRGDSMVFKRVTCLRDVLGRVPDMQDIKRAIVKGISDAFGATLYPRALTPAEISDIDHLIEEKYGTQEWTWRR